MNALILIFEKNDTVRRLLREWLEVLFPDCRVIKTASNNEAIALARSRSPHVILVGITSFERDGIETIREIKTAAPSAKIVALAVGNHAVYRDEVISAGAKAYVHKWRINTELEPTLRALLTAENERSAPL